MKSDDNPKILSFTHCVARGHVLPLNRIWEFLIFHPTHRLPPNFLETEKKNYMKCGNFTTHQSEIIEHELHHAKANVKFCLEFYLFSFIKGQFSSSMARALTVRFMHGALARKHTSFLSIGIWKFNPYSNYIANMLDQVFPTYTHYSTPTCKLILHYSKKKSVKISSQ